MEFECKIPNCKFKSHSPQLFTSHCLQIHNTGLKTRFYCGIRKCVGTFSSYSAFNTHIRRDHFHGRNTVSKTCSSITANNEKPVYTIRTSKFVCSTCQKCYAEMKGLVTHTKTHFNKNDSIECPFTKCGKKYSVISSFTSHVSKYHRNQTNNNALLSASNTIPDVSSQSDDLEENTRFVEGSDQTGSPNENAHMECEECDNISTASSNEEKLVDSLARFFLTLEKKHHVPESTSQIIYNHFSSLINLTSNQLITSLIEKLSTHVPCGVLKPIIESVFHRELLQPMGDKDPLRSIHSRQQYYKNRFKFVEPVAIRLGLNQFNKECFMHYVPIEHSLQALLEDSTVYEQYQKNMYKPESGENIYKDISDGRYIKTHPLFSKDKSLLQIILYQDEFLVANPLGSSRKDLKMFAVYYTLGNINAWNRSKVDPLQLVLLCKSVNLKYFGQHKIFQSLIKSLQHVQREGILIKEQVIKGVLAYIAGDNLGSHFIGGFTENFSSATHFCRFCTITRQDFINNGVLTGPLRTEANYNASVVKVKDDHLHSHEGVKQDSVFNEIEDFHVVDGLPPCIGHDIFEGVAQYDIPLALKYFESREWFTCDVLNRKIATFDFSCIGSENKPCPVTCEGRNMKLGGHAVQTWSLLRALPILIGNKIRDKDDLVWRMVLLLIESVQIICSPHLDIDLVAILQGTVEEYLELRRQLFPDVRLRPKHHYLYHYAELVVKHGPLMRLWTMRFESKHKYFKDVIRSARNTKNVTRTMAVKHQLLQADYFASFGLFPTENAMVNASPYRASEFTNPINHAVMYSERLREYTQLLVGRECLFRGTKYKTGDLVVLKQDIRLTLLHIEIVLLKDGVDIFLLGNVGHGDVIADLQIVDVEITEEKTCQSILSLIDFQPYIPITDRDNNQSIVLKHKTGP